MKREIAFIVGILLATTKSSISFFTPKIFPRNGPTKQMVSELHIPGYDKGAGNAFAITGAHLSVATLRAERLSARFTAHTDPEPFTAIVELVKLLTTLRG